MAIKVNWEFFTQYIIKLHATGTSTTSSAENSSYSDRLHFKLRSFDVCVWLRRGHKSYLLACKTRFYLAVSKFWRFARICRSKIHKSSAELWINFRGKFRQPDWRQSSTFAHNSRHLVEKSRAFPTVERRLRRTFIRLIFAKFNSGRIIFAPNFQLFHVVYMQFNYLHRL